MSQQDEYINKLQGVLLEEGLGKLRALKVEFCTTLERFPILGEELQTIIDAGDGVDYDMLVPRVEAQLNQAANLLGRLELLPDEERAVAQMAEFLGKLRTKITLRTVEVWAKELELQTAIARQWLKAESERIRREKAEKDAREKAEKEAREKAEKEAREKDEKEVREKDEKEVREKAERILRERKEEAEKKRPEEETIRKDKKFDSILSMVMVVIFFGVWLTLNQIASLKGFPSFLIGFAAMFAVIFVAVQFRRKNESK